MRDVSLHPDVSELYLAADVLVTDYSSTMFDFAVTGRPMAFLTYDLADFQHRVRGFYFELADEAPGPLVETTSELIGVLRDLDATRARYADATRASASATAISRTAARRSACSSAWPVRTEPPPASGGRASAPPGPRS